MPPEQHDRAVALASHLPLLAASALTLTVAQSPDATDATDALTLAAGGFRDTTRIASGSPRMARDICLTNSAPLIASLDAYITTLQALRQQIAEQNPTLEGTFTTAKDARDHWVSGQTEM